MNKSTDQYRAIYKAGYSVGKADFKALGLTKALDVPQDTDNPAWAEGHTHGVEKAHEETDTYTSPSTATYGLYDEYDNFCEGWD